MIRLTPHVAWDGRTYMCPEWVDDQPADPRAVNIARAVRRLCDGKDHRLGAAEYQP